MKHQYLCKSKPVFHIDTIGTKFYIILEGVVGVYIRLPKKKTQSELDQNPLGITDPVPMMTVINNEDEELTCVKELTVGAGFGELGLINNKPRLASIICHTNCHFATLDRKEFNEILLEKEEEKIIKQMGFFASMPLFDSWNFNQIKLLYLNSVRLNCTKGEYIYKEGSEPMAAYIIVSGDFTIQSTINVSNSIINSSNNNSNSNHISSLINKGKQQTKQIKVAIYSNPEIFGEEEIFEKINKRKCSAICQSVDGQIIMIKKRDFEQRVLSEQSSFNYLKSRIEQKKQRFIYQTSKITKQIDNYYPFLCETNNKFKFDEDIEPGTDNNNSNGKRASLKSNLKMDIQSLHFIQDKDLNNDSSDDQECNQQPTFTIDKKQYQFQQQQKEQQSSQTSIQHTNRKSKLINININGKDQGLIKKEKLVTLAEILEKKEKQLEIPKERINRSIELKNKQQLFISSLIQQKIQESNFTKILQQKKQQPLIQQQQHQLLSLKSLDNQQQQLNSMQIVNQSVQYQQQQSQSPQKLESEQNLPQLIDDFEKNTTNKNNISRNEEQSVSQKLNYDFFKIRSGNIDNDSNDNHSNNNNKQIPNKFHSINRKESSIKNKNNESSINVSNDQTLNNINNKKINDSNNSELEISQPSEIDKNENMKQRSKPQFFHSQLCLSPLHSTNHLNSPKNQMNQTQTHRIHNLYSKNVRYNNNELLSNSLKFSSSSAIQNKQLPLLSSREQIPETQNSFSSALKKKQDSQIGATASFHLVKNLYYQSNPINIKNYQEFEDSKREISQNKFFRNKYNSLTEIKDCLNESVQKQEIPSERSQSQDILCEQEGKRSLNSGVNSSVNNLNNKVNSQFPRRAHYKKEMNNTTSLNMNQQIKYKFELEQQKQYSKQSKNNLNNRTNSKNINPNSTKQDKMFLLHPFNGNKLDTMLINNSFYNNDVSLTESTPKHKTPCLRKGLPSGNNFKPFENSNKFNSLNMKNLSPISHLISYQMA